MKIRFSMLVQSDFRAVVLVLARGTNNIIILDKADNFFIRFFHIERSIIQSAFDEDLKYKANTKNATWVRFK